jgi:hypothetical protein
MTPTELLREIRRMPPADRRRVLEELSKESGGVGTNGSKEQVFLDRMVERGLVLLTASGSRSRKKPQKFSPVKVTGEPVSETIIKERS